MPTTAQPERAVARQRFVGFAVRRRRLLVSGLLLALVAGCGANRVAGTRASSSTSGLQGVSVSSGSPVSPPAAAAGFACTIADPYAATAEAAVRQAVTLGDTEAVLTGTSASNYGSANGLHDGVLTITTAGHAAVGLAIAPPANTVGVALGTIGVDGADHRGSLCLVRFTPGSAPVALLAMTTGGAHCCTVIRAVQPASGDRAPSTVDRDFGNYGALLRQDRSGPLIVTADDAFAYAFGSYAGSHPPIQILTVDNFAYVDVTRAHPDLVRADLDQHWKLYTDPTLTERLGVLAGWAADKCLLDPTKRAPDLWSFLDQQNAAGKLTAPSGWPSGSAFIAALHTLLVDRGYCVATAASASPTS
jgi:hypothetical protein